MDFDGSSYSDSLKNKKNAENSRFSVKSILVMDAIRVCKVLRDQS